MQSNYYADRIYAEHPVALWPLDEDVTFVSPLKQNTDDDLDGWTKTNIATVALETAHPFELPADHLPIYYTLATVSSGEAECLLVSQVYDHFDNIPLALSMYAMCEGDAMASYEIGVVTETVENNNTWTVYNGINVAAGFAGDWIRLFGEINVSQRFKFYIKYKYLAGISTPVKVYINGFSAGELAINYVSWDDGVSHIAPTADLDPFLDSDIRLVPANRYASTTGNGYYCVAVDPGSNWSASRLLAKNDGVPMVFGANNSTAIYQHNGQPGLVVPAKGFLHENGRYGNYTVEFWIRQGKINKSLPKYNGSNNPQAQAIRFFGPLGSQDGLYRDDTNLYLCVDDKIVSHNIKNWYRPILVGIKIAGTRIMLFVNGEYVGNIEVDKATVALAATPDWLGFWNNGLDLFELDSVAIFTYPCPNPIMKRRYAIGQGVSEINSIEKQFLGKSIVFDYTKANYTRNVVYPDSVAWDQGQSSNMILGYPTMTLPDFSTSTVFTAKSHREWLDDQVAVSAGGYVPAFKLRPTSQYNQKPAYIKLPNLDFMLEGVAGIRIDVKPDSTTKYGLLQFYNKSTNKYVYLNFDSNNASLSYNGLDVYYSAGVAGTTRRAVVVNLDLVTKMKQFGSFWSNPSNIEVTLINWPSKIYGVSFFNRYSYLVNNQPTGALTVQTVSDTSDPVIGNYTYALSVLPNGMYTDDPKSVGYWKDILPLAYFAKKKIVNGQEVYAVDLLQFNSAIDDSPLSGLSDKVQTTIQFIKSENSGLTDEANEYSGTDASNWIVLPNNFLGTKYIVRDGTVITFPETVNIANTFVVFRIRLTDLAKNISRVSIKRAELCSLSAFEDSDFFPMGTRYGHKVYPCRLSGTRYIPLNKAAVRIGKRPLPYLHASDDDGILVLSRTSTVNIVDVSGTDTYWVDNRQIMLSAGMASVASIPGIAMKYAEQDNSIIAVPLNQSKTESIAGLKFWVKLDDIYIGNVINEKKVGELLLTKTDGVEKISFWVVPEYTGIDESPIRYSFQMRDANGAIYEDALLLSGVYQTVTPVLEPKRWSQISIVFGVKQELNGPSFFNLYSGISLQNMSVHEPSIISESNQTAQRSWLVIESAYANWSAVYNGGANIWSDILYVTKPQNYFFDPLGLTKALFGTNSIVATSSNADDLMLNTGDLDSIMDVKWSTQTYKPA